MSGRSLDSFLFQTFSHTIRKNIYILINNFPKTEEDQKNLTKPILNYLVDFNIIIEEIISKCSILASVNLRNFFLEILEYFNQIPLDMNKTKFNAPLFFNDEMKEKFVTSYPLRLCTYYVSHSILTQVIYHIVLRTNFLKNEDYPLIYSTINQILFHEINEVNSFKLDLINVSKWSIILHTMSKIIPDIIISDAFNHIQSSQLLHNNYHIFILRLYSFLYYPKHILNNFPLISVTFQHLFSILSSNKVSNQLLIAGNKFIRNFLGYTIQYEQTPELNSLFKEINRILIKIQNEQCSWNSTLVLFTTLSDDKLSFFPLQKFFTLITRQFPTNSFKITDIIKTFIAILNGHFYMNLFTIEKIDVNFFKSAPNKKDKGYLQKMLNIIYSNSTQFKHCQKELGLLLSKISSFNFAWFIRKQLNNLINKDFFQFNSEAVLYCATIILSNESIILQNSKITSPNDPIVIQFKKSIIELCQKVMDDHPIDLFTTKCWIFDTNDFTSSLSTSSLNYEIEQILGNTSLVPLINEADKEDVAIEIFNVIEKEINEDADIDFDSYLNSVDEGGLRFYQLNPINHSSIENTLLLCLLLAQEIEKSSPHLFNRIPMYLFSDSPFVSALTIRIIQAFIHVKHDQSILNSLLTLQTFEYEQLYIYGLALVRTAKSMVNCKIGLTVNSSNCLLSWQWILLSAPFSIIRELGLKLAEIIVPLLPYENFPNIHTFIRKHDEEIFKKSITMLCLTFTYKNELFTRFKFVKFNEIILSNSYLLYFSFFTNALKIFTMNEDKCPQLNHTMNITHAQAISLINAKKNIISQDNFYFILNLISLRLATSSVFDKYTSPEQIFSLLKLGETFLNRMKIGKRVYYFFFLSVNPYLELHFSARLSSIYVDIIAFHFRIFMIDYFKANDDMINFNATDLLSIKNYKFLSIEVEYLKTNDGNDDDDHLNGLESIEKALRNIIGFFDDSRMIKKEKIKQIDSDRMVILSGSTLPKSINNLLCGLIILFEKLRAKLVIRNDSFFLNLKNYKKNQQPFNPKWWFPFLYNISSDSTNNFPYTVEMASNALSIYSSFVQIPEEFIKKIVNEQEKVIRNEFKKFWCLLLIQYPKLLLPLFCESVITNDNQSLTLFNCFKKPSNTLNDLSLVKEFIVNDNYSLNNEFDKIVVENIGVLLSLSFFNLTLENKKVSFFNIIYNLSLFAIASNLDQSEKLIPILTQLMKIYSPENLPILIHQMINLSGVLAASFKAFTEQFLNNFFKIISLNQKSAKNDMTLFIQFAIPWFSNIKLCNNETIGIVPCCKSSSSLFTSFSFLNQLFALNFKQNETEINFSQCNLPTFSQSILDILVKDSLKYVVDFVLRENVRNADSVLIFLLSKNSKKLIHYFVGHLSFEFSYFMEIQNNQRQLYNSMINKLLSVFIWILSKNDELISPYFHILFVYCFVRQSSKPSGKKVTILNEISKILNKKSAIDCLEKLNSEEVVHEVFQWMVSFDDLNESMFAVELFQYMIENKMVTSPSMADYIIDINANIKIVCILLSQFDGEIPSVYFEYVSKLMIILCSLDSPPVDIAIDLLRCNSEKFSPLFTTSLEIVSSNVIKLKKHSKRIFLNLITADLNHSIIENIFGLILDMIFYNMFDLKNDPDVFFFMIPYLQVNGELNDPKINFLSEIFGHEKSDLIINSYKKVIDDKKSVSDFFNVEFNQLVLKMVNQISGEIQFLIFSFFMKVVDICEYKYFHSIYMISLVLLKNKDKHSALCSSVFSPLSKFFISHQNDKDKLNELIEFIQIFEELDSNALPPKKRNRPFPIIFSDKIKFDFAFRVSYPVTLTDFKYIESNFVDELESFVLSVQNMDLIKQERRYNLLKMQKIEKSSSVHFNFDLKNGAEKIDKLLNASNRKKTNLIPSNVPKIINVDHSVFRIVEKIDELID